MPRGRKNRTRLGQLLVSRGWITDEQLSIALSSQRVVGGRLGTCLLETAALSEELLLRGLGEQHGVSPVDLVALRAASSEVPRLLAPELARKYQAVPYQLLGGRVDIAMADPGDLRRQDELAFVLGRTVHVHVASQVRLIEALARHYGEPCPKRFAQLLERLNRDREPADLLLEFDGAAELPATAGEAALPVDLPASIWEEGPPAEGTTAELGVMSHDSRGAQLAETAAPDAPMAPLEAGAPPSTQPARADNAEQAREIPGGPGEVLAGDRWQARLDGCSSLVEVGDLVLDLLARGFRRVALLRVWHGRVEGWRGRGGGIDLQRLGAVRIPLDQPSIFLNLSKGGSFFLGELPAMEAHRQLAGCWHEISLPQCLLLPIRIADRLVAVVYLDNGEQGLDGIDLRAMQDLGTRVAGALERLILRRKQAEIDAGIDKVPLR